MAGKAATGKLKSQNRQTEALDIAAVRRDFPVLDQTVNGKKLVYLDNAATSQKPKSVIDTLTRYYEEYNSNVHRGIHALSQEATERYEEARGKIASFIGASSEREIVFVKNSTEAINLVAYGWARKYLRPNDEVITTETEHHSNIVPWQLVAESTGARFRYLPVRDHAAPFDIDGLRSLITSRTKLVAVTHVSNVLGTVTPVADVAEMAHAAGAVLLVDGSQSAPHMPLDVVDLDVDFFAVTGHKMLGPTGIGFLYAREELLDRMDPFLSGGDMIATVTMQGATWNELPYKFEAGTPNIADSIGLGAAVDYLSSLGMDRIESHERKISEYAIERLQEIEGLTLYGPTDASLKGAVFSFNVDGIHSHDVGQVLDSEGVAVRTGHHCAQPLMAALGIGSAARASAYFYNFEEEIDTLVDAIRKTQKFFS